MKKFVLAIALLSISASVFAFRIDARIRINDTRAEAFVVNEWTRPIICRGQLRAVDAAGRWVDAWINNTIIYPGRHAYLSAQAYGIGNYIRDARANINCNWY